MIRIIDFIIGWIITVLLFVIFAPLLFIVALLTLVSSIPKIENTFVFNIVAGIIMWVDKFVKGFKPPWTLKKKLYFALTYLTSIALWVILYVIF